MDLDRLTHQDLIEDPLQCAILHFVAYKSTSSLLRWEVIVFVSPQKQLQSAERGSRAVSHSSSPSLASTTSAICLSVCLTRWTACDAVAMQCAKFNSVRKIPTKVPIIILSVKYRDPLKDSSKVL